MELAIVFWILHRLQCFLDFFLLIFLFNFTFLDAFVTCCTYTQNICFWFIGEFLKEIQRYLEMHILLLEEKSLISMRDFLPDFIDCFIFVVNVSVHCMLSIFALPRPSNLSLQHIYQVHLGRFLREGDFLPEVKDCLQSLVSTALSIYRRACLRLRPTPTKLHYAFSFADISKVSQGSKLIE